eukprot:803171-Prorocentrum_minimum.AAC.1
MVRSPSPMSHSWMAPSVPPDSSARPPGRTRRQRTPWLVRGLLRSPGAGPGRCAITVRTALARSPAVCHTCARTIPARQCARSVLKRVGV